MTEHKKTQDAVLTQPTGRDPNWRGKVAIAQQARERAAAMRRDKPSSFRTSVGRRAV